MKNLKRRVFTHKSKSKIFITILCIFGLLFSYSCKCRNQVSDPNNIPTDNGIKTNDQKDPTVFSASLVDAESVKTLVVKSDGTFSQEITLKFSSANTIDTITPTAVSQNDLNLTKDSFTYDKATGKLTISGLDDFKNQDGGTSKNITTSFTLTTKDAGVGNTSTAIDVSLDITRAIDLSSDTIEKNSVLQGIFKGLGLYQYDNYEFNFINISTTANKITIKNSMQRNVTAAPVGDMNKFGTDIKNDLEGQQYGKGYFSSVTFDYNGSTIKDKVATLSFSFTLSDTYGSGNGTFTIEADITLPQTANQNAGEGSWKPKG